MRAIIDRLSDPESRLLTTERGQAAAGEGTLEVAHEALIRGWPQLRTWIETDRAGLRTHLRLTEAAKEWADAEPEAKEGALYTGARLAVASEWAASHRDELGALEAAFLSASQEHERQRKADEAEQNRRLAEAERQRAEEAEAAAGHQKKLSQRFLIAAAVSLLLAAAAGLQTLRANWASQSATTAANKAKLSEASEKEARQEAEKSDPWRRKRRRSRPRVNSPPSPGRSGTSAWTVRSSWRLKPSRPRAPLRHDIVSTKLFRTDQNSSRSCIQERAVSLASPSAPTARPSPPDRRGGGGVVLWDVADARRLMDGPPPREGGPGLERRLQPRRQDPRRWISVARRRRGAVGRGHAPAPGGGSPPREGGPGLERRLQPRRQNPRRRIHRRRRQWQRRRRGAVGRGHAQRAGRRTLSP